MCTKFSYLLLFSLLLVHCEMIMLGEAAICTTHSRVYRGMCFRSSNCVEICETKGYKSGKCKELRCKCITNCGGSGSGYMPPGGGGGETPPSVDDADQGPPSAGGDDGQEPPSY